MAEEISSMLIRISTDVTELKKGMHQAQESIQSINKATQETAKATQSSFDVMQKSTLEVTAAFIKFDQTQSAIQNHVLALANANERLANAQDRVKDAQKNLTRATEDYEETVRKSGRNSDESRQALRRLEDVQEEVTRSQRGLEISQNNLNRVQNQALGLYLSTASSLVSLAGSAKNLIPLYHQMTAAAKNFNIAMALTPQGLIATAVSLGAGLLLYQSFGDKANEASRRTQEAMDSMSMKVDMVISEMDFEEPIRQLTELERKIRLFEAGGMQTDDELKMQKEIESLEKKRIEQRKQFREISPDASQEALNVLTDTLDKEIISLKTRLNDEIQLRQLNEKAKIDVLKDSLLEQEALDNGLTLAMIRNKDERMKALDEEIRKIEEKTSTTAQLYKISIDLLGVNFALNDLNRNVFNSPEEFFAFSKRFAQENIRQSFGSRTTPTIKGPIHIGGDFLLRNDGTMMKFSPDDNIVGFKDTLPFGRGNVVNVTVNVQGSVAAERDLAQTISRAMNQNIFARTNFI